jgi:putative copper export protein
MSVRPLALGLVTNALHVAAMGTWVGVVIALLVARPVVSVATLRADLARRAGSVATIALIVAAGSGALLSFQHLTGTGDLAMSSYGRVIVAKLATLVAVLALAMGARRSVGAPERWWRGEIAALVAVLLLAAVLVSLPPPA